jgi:hypothetical protein
MGAYRTRSAFRRLVAAFLALALVLSWQAALEHPVDHVDELGQFVHLHDEHSGGERSDAELLCDALAALTACAALAQSTFVPPAPRSHPPSSLSRAPRVAEPPPFLSQGPPRSV